MYITPYQNIKNWIEQCINPIKTITKSVYPPNSMKINIITLFNNIKGPFITSILKESASL